MPDPREQGSHGCQAGGRDVQERLLSPPSGDPHGPPAVSGFETLGFRPEQVSLRRDGLAVVAGQRFEFGDGLVALRFGAQLCAESRGGVAEAGFVE
jgi:hypothetical protein